MLYFAELVQHVEQTQPWMAESHPGPGITHDDSGLFTLRPLVTMDRATGTGGFFLSIRTLEEAFLRVRQKLLAFGAGVRAAGRMVIAAVNANHHLEGPVLPCQPGFKFGHGAKHTAVPNPGV